MVNPENVELSASRDIQISGAGFGRILCFPDLYPAVPALLATRIQLELLLGEQLIDLRAVSEVVLSDPGATLQVLRLVGAEYGTEPNRPVRMEDCLASFDAKLWFEAICAATIEPAFAPEELCAAWRHAHRIAQCAMELAEDMDGYSPEEACLVGLLHELETLPALLGWDRKLFPETGAGRQLISAWNLPAYLLPCSKPAEEDNLRWIRLLTEAHRRVERRDKVA